MTLKRLAIIALLIVGFVEYTKAEEPSLSVDKLDYYQTLLDECTDYEVFDYELKECITYVPSDYED